MKNKITVIITLTVAGFICLFIWLISGNKNTCYYTQIDNSNINQQESDGGVIDFTGGMTYAYTLPSCDEKGNEKEITFGTMRELREGAFIRLTVVPIRGVTAWEEVQYEELPEAVQNHYAAPAGE